VRGCVSKTSIKNLDDARFNLILFRNTTAYGAIGTDGIVVTWRQRWQMPALALIFVSLSSATALLPCYDTPFRDTMTLA